MDGRRPFVYLVDPSRRSVSRLLVQIGSLETATRRVSGNIMLPASVGRADMGEMRNPDCENVWRTNGDGIWAEIALERIPELIPHRLA